jgi:hypothetical protein
VQADELVQDTPESSSFWVGEVLGLVTIDQTDPFQDSIRV